MEKLLNRVKNIILSPKSEWQAIKTEQAAAKDIIINYVAILAVIPFVASIIGMGIVGFSLLGQTVRAPLGHLIVSGVVQYIMTIIGVIIAGAIINSLAPTFESKKNSTQALKVAVYSYTPAWVASILDVIPVLSPLAVLASLYGIYLLYLGLGPLMETPDNKTVGYTVVSIIVMIAVLIVMGLITAGIVGVFGLSMMPGVAR